MNLVTTSLYQGVKVTILNGLWMVFGRLKDEEVENVRRVICSAWSCCQTKKGPMLVMKDLNQIKSRARSLF